MSNSIVRSMRLRTLPLSLAGVVCGGLLAIGEGGHGNWFLLLLVAMTACALQVLSNLSNELGDYKNGVDGLAERQGPAYSMLEGGLTVSQMEQVIRATAVCCCVAGAAMVWLSFGTLLDWRAVALLLLGAVAIWAATHYTLGKNPYGYRGLGDVFVFVFFGLVSVLGSHYVMAHSIDLKALWPAVGVGLLSVAVLNVNNIRDMQSDRGHRQTTPLRLGLRRARVYHTALVTLGWVAMAASYSGARLGAWLVLCTLPLFVWHVVGVWRHEGRGLDPMLPLLVMSTFLLSVIYSAGMMYGV